MVSREAVLDCDYWEVFLVKTSAGPKIVMQPFQRHTPVGPARYSTDMTAARQVANQILRFADQAEGKGAKKR